MHQFEIEIKSLLGDESKATAFRERLQARYPKAQLVEESQQLNHYFVGDDLAALTKTLGPHLTPDNATKLQDLTGKAKKPSVRTRQLNDQVILVVKASVDDTSSSNGITRMELEITFPDLSLEQLDQLVLDSGFKYQAKWSRQREAYKLADNLTVSIDKNAGYGYLSEFELVVSDDTGAEAARQQLRDLMTELEVEELAQDRLERMFAHYNEHWPEYYGTENTFVIE